MRAFQIPDVKSFMSLLLLQDTFDAFLLKEATITTSITHTLDGRLHAAFFDKADFSDPYIFWRDVKPHCFSIIKGKRTPLYFKFVLKQNQANTKKLLDQTGLDLLPEQIAGLYLNCQFDGERLLCTTGTALTFFTMDRILDQIWDEMIIKFFKANKIFFVES